MKKGISALLALILCLGCFTGCVGSIDNSSSVPTGDALLMEGADPAEETIAPDSQDLTPVSYTHLWWPTRKRATRWSRP